MKNILGLVFIMSLIFSARGQNSYFPIGKGNSWVYLTSKNDSGIRYLNPASKFHVDSSNIVCYEFVYAEFNAYRHGQIFQLDTVFVGESDLMRWNGNGSHEIYIPSSPKIGMTYSVYGDLMRVSEVKLDTCSYRKEIDEMAVLISDSLNRKFIISKKYGVVRIETDGDYWEQLVGYKEN
ncbi:MAG: hypothetical protein ACI9J3_002557 [Parvicellaceae bacterium]|jgi:hypothetical protein